MKRCNIALTMGDPKGIGPEIAVTVAEKLKDRCDITIYGAPEVLSLAVGLKKISGQLNIKEVGHLGCDINLLEDRRGGRLAYEALEAATNDVLTGRADALVTCPINKHNWSLAEIPFIGHTEFLTSHTGRDLEFKVQSAMMMASPKLKVTLATIHEAVKEISNRLTTEKIVTAGTLTHDALKRYFRVPYPRLAVAALNPHSGDSGLIGDEETRIIVPAIDELNNRDINASGPYPADTIFARAVSGDYDAVIAMYHDQGLAPIKTLYYKQTVNITLGLPIIRTSVDHGTAEDIAWRGVADDANLMAAVEMAVKMLGLSLRGAKGDEAISRNN